MKTGLSRKKLGKIFIIQFIATSLAACGSGNHACPAVDRNRIFRKIRAYIQEKY